ncbi:hypothetical protein BBL07_11885 [Agrobacterium vitis]|nr:hypothetical protein BBL07_11885 [Agrobacterium vitis]
MGVFIWGLPPSGLPTISPSRGEISKKQCRVQFSIQALFNESISPLEGEMSGRTEGGNPILHGRHVV